MIVKALAGNFKLVPYIFCGFPRIRRNLPQRVEKGLYLLDTEEDYREIEAYLTVWCDEAIMVSRVPLIGLELDLRDPLVAAQTLSEYRGIRYAMKLESKLPHMEEEDIMLFLKMSSLLKRWYWEALKDSGKVYRLFQALSQSRKHFLREYFMLRQEVSSGVLFSSVLTLFQRIREFTTEKEGLSSFYRQEILKVRHQEKHFVPAALWLLSAPKTLPLDVRIILFCLKLRGGRV